MAIRRNASTQLQQRRRSRNAARKLVFELMESRLLLTAAACGPLRNMPLCNGDNADFGSAVLVENTVTVQGTDRNDHIAVRQDWRGKVLVELNGRRLGPFDATRVVVDGRAGHDKIRAIGTFLKPLEIHGGPGNDELKGGSGPDHLVGGPGNDVLLGGAGNDVLKGGAGQDVVKGQAGHDELFGNGGKDTLRGGAGNDSVWGGAGADELYGDGGWDTLYGQQGNDQLFGGAGRDLLAGGDGDDWLVGAAGNDLLSAGAGSDRASGGTGRDLLLGGDGADWLDGGSHSDVLMAGPSIHDDDSAALRSLLALWITNATYAQRVQSITDSSLAADVRLNDSTVSDDQDVDRMLGAAGSDLFLAADSDKLLDHRTAETKLLTDKLTLPIANRAAVSKSGVQQMPSIAVNPSDANHVVIAYMDYSLPTADTQLPGEGYAGIGVAVSRDGGTTWQQTAISLPAGFDQAAGHPIARFDDQGRVFVTFMAATFLGQRPALIHPDFFNPERNASDREFGFTSNNGVFVARSIDGGTTFNAPVAVDVARFEGEEVAFRVLPDLAIDTFRQLPDGRPNPNYGNLYLAWSRLYPVGAFPGHPEINGGTDVFVAVSRDAGQTWEIKLQQQDGNLVTVIQDPENTGGLPGLGIPDASQITVGPEGNIYLTHTGGGDFVIHRSTDGGASFVAPDRVAGRRVAFGAGFLTFINADPLPGNQFRTRSVRLLVADPARPGTLYAADVQRVVDAQGNEIDAADVIFAHSTDYGDTWSTAFQVGGNDAHVLNDENDGQMAATRSDDVISGQAFPRLATDASGNIGVIWYDTRRDPAHEVVDVFGTLSKDGGRTFVSNFRVTGDSFDADVGRFTDALGDDNYALGDFIGLAMSGNHGYAAWTDTRLGSQDIFFARFPIEPSPSALNDRFEPNNGPELSDEPSRLGRILTRQELPKLSLPAGDEDWFHFRAGATGTLTVSALQSQPGARLRLDLYDDSGKVLSASGTNVVDSRGQIVGQQIEIPSRTGTEFHLRVQATGSGVDRYSLALQSLTAELGTIVHQVAVGEISVGDEAYYLVAAAAAGSLDVRLTTSSTTVGNLNLDVLDPNGLSVLAEGHVSSPAGAGEVEGVEVHVEKGNSVLIRVSGTAGSRGDYQLEISNLDQFTGRENAALLFPAGAGPSQAALGDLNGDNNLDLAIANAFSDTLSALLGNGDGTFQSPRQFPIGSFVTPPGDIGGSLPSFGRGVAIAQLNADSIPDVVVTNFASADVSVLLGRGDGTFQTQRRFDATNGPVAVETGDLNADGLIDLAVLSNSTPRQTYIVATLLGRGDGTFLPQKTIEVPARSVTNSGGNLRITKLNADSFPDVVVTGSNTQEVTVLLGRGDGTFDPGTQFTAGRLGVGLDVADINGDGANDIVNTAFDDHNSIVVLFGNGDGTFQAPESFFVGQNPVGVKLEDIASQVQLPDGSMTLGPPDGHLDAVVAVSGVALFLQSAGPPQIAVLPGLVDEVGVFTGFGTPHQLALGVAPQDVEVGDVNLDGLPDVLGVDRDGVRIVLSQQSNIVPNSSPETARDLGTIVHVVQPTLTITPAQTEAWYRLQVPNEATAGARDQVLDFSGGFASERGAGLAMEVRNASGQILGSGARIRVVAAQGEELLLRVFGQSDSQGDVGAGAYSLVINVLPQVVGVEAHALLPGVGGQPGGPTTSIVLTLQGDRLDPVRANDKNNYRITWLGPDGVVATTDDQLIPLSTSDQPVVYSPSTNVDILTGTRYPTAIHQTVTLLFDQPLPAGSYQIEILPGVQTEDFNPGEDAILSDSESFGAHPIVQLNGSDLIAGATIGAHNLVFAQGSLGSLEAFDAGTPFLSQLHDDLAAILDTVLTTQGDADGLSQTINDHILQRLTAATSQVATPPRLLVVWLDPGTFEITSPTGQSISYDIIEDELEDEMEQAYADVIGNIEVIIIAGPQGVYDFTISNVGGLARGGYVLTEAAMTTAASFTTQIRNGVNHFPINTSGAI